MILKELKNKIEELQELVEKFEKNNTIIQRIPALELEWGETHKKNLNWEEAKEWCEEQGKGWRLPTIVELQQAYYNKVDGFSMDYYWSFTKSLVAVARIQSFSDGSVNNDFKKNSYAVRCVRTIK